MHVLPFARAQHARAAVLVVYDHFIPPESFAAQQRRKALPRQIAARRQWQPCVIEQRRHKVVRADHLALHDPLFNGARLAYHKRDLNRVFIHIGRIRAVALAPKTVLAAAKAVIAGKDNQGLLSQPFLFQPFQQTTDLQIHRRHGGKIPFEHLSIAQATLAERMAYGPRMHVFLRARVKRTVVIRVDDVLRMTRPRAVRSGVVHAQIERLGALCGAIYIFEGVVGNGRSHIAGRLNQFPVADHRRVVVFPAAALVHKPMIKSVLSDLTVSEVPLSAQTTAPTVLGQHIRIGDFIL